jgi:outer membrane immunogenic protein
MHLFEQGARGTVEERRKRRTFMSKRNFAGLIIAATLISSSAFAQEEATYKNDVAVQAFGSFVKSTTQNGVEQSATNSGGVLASYRFFFNQNNGVELDYGYSLNTQSYSGQGVGSYSHEGSAAYVFRLPRRHWSPFVLAGAGGLVFDPKNFTGASTQGRAAFVYGAGADFKLSRHVFVRAEYRGLVYNSPTFDLSGLNGLDRITHRAEPSIGFGYSF